MPCPFSECVIGMQFMIPPPRAPPPSYFFHFFFMKMFLVPGFKKSCDIHFVTYFATI